MQLLDGTDCDDPVQAAALELELEQWSQGKFALLDELLDMVWLSQDEALQLAPAVFGLEYCFDNDDRVIWSYPPGGPEVARTSWGDRGLDRARRPSRRSKAAHP